MIDCRAGTVKLTCDESMIGVVLVRDKALIVMCHWYGVTVYVTYDTTSPGNP